MNRMISDQNANEPSTSINIGHTENVTLLEVQDNDKPVTNHKPRTRPKSGYALGQDQSPDGRHDPWKSRRGNAPSRVPVEPTNCFDMIISCGFGSKAYTLGPSFADPQFKIRFTTKVYLVLLVQLLVYILWTTLVLTSKTLVELHMNSYGIVICSSIIYLLIYGSVRFTRRGEDGLCFMSYLIMLIFLSICGALASGWMAVMFPCGLFVTGAIFLTIIILVLGNKYCDNLSILTNMVYILALCGALVSSGLMAVLYHHCKLDSGTTTEKLGSFVLPLSVIPSLMSLMLVYEMKRLIGGRRTNLNDQEYIVAAIVL